VSVDASGEVLVVAGNWKEARGIAYTTFDRAPAQAISLTLASPIRLRAKFLDDKDRPVACDSLIADLPPDVSWLNDVVSGSATTNACDARGAVALGPLLSMPLILDVRPHAGMPMRIAVDAPAPGATEDLGILRVKNGESIRVVVNDDAGHPVQGAKVTARGSAGILLTVAGTTGDDGAVELSGLPKNAVISLAVTAKGFIASRDDRLELDASPFVVRLSRGAAISGKVRDADGLPVAGAEVSLASETAETDDARRPESTDDQGAFELDGVADGAWRVTASAPGFSPSAPVKVAILDHRAAKDLVLTLAPAGGITGRVVDGSGTPVEGARLRLVDAPERDDLSPIAETMSGTEGRFELRAAAPTNSWLVTSKPGFGPTAQRAPDAAHASDLVLTLPDAAGLVVHLASAAHSGKTLRAKDGAGVGQTANVTGAADVAFTDLAPGRGLVWLHRGVQRDVTLVARETAEVTLDPTAAIQGRVTFEGAPAPRVHVTEVKIDKDGGLSSGVGSFTDDRGRYRIEGIAGGSYRIAAVGEAGRAEAAVDVAEGETAELDLALRSVRLAVTVTDGATGKPLAGVSVRAAPAGAPCQSSLGMSSSGDPGELGFEVFVGATGCLSSQTNAAGSARLSLAAPGAYDLEIGDDAYETWKQSLAFGEGTTTRRVSLTRKPDKKDDKPHVIANLRTDPPGLSGMITCIAGGNTNSSSPVSGRADCGAMIPGPGEIVFHVDGYGSGRSTFDVPESGELVVDVDVPRGGMLVVPLSHDPAAPPQLVDASGVIWSGGPIRGRPVASFEDVPNVGRAWVFRDLPPGQYIATIDGKSRSAVPLVSGATAIAY
jgi:protocatechuate 3,4-dioxygenase beta subunit